MCYPITEQVHKPMDIFNIALTEPLPPSVVYPLSAARSVVYNEARNGNWNSNIKFATLNTTTFSALHVELEKLEKPREDLPSVDTLISTLQNCRESQNLACAKCVHVVVCDYGLETLNALGNCFILTFLECGSLHDAQQVFDRLVHQDESSCTSLMHGYIESEKWQQALHLFEKMREDFEDTNSPVFVVLLKACAHQNWVKRGQELHTEIAKEELERDLKVGTALVDMYAKCGALAEAQDVFDNIEDRDVVLWTALIGGYAEHGFSEEALGCLERMQEEGVPVNSFTYVCSLKACGGIGDMARGLKLHAEISKDGLEENFHVCSTLVDMYAEFGLLVEARRVLDKLPVRNVVGWNALITGYVEHGLNEEVLECLEQMQAEGVSPNAITHVCSLKACSTIGAIEKGREIHASVNKMGLERDVYLGSILVDMYATCGSLEEAHNVFSQLPFQDVVSWTALIRGYIGQGLGKEAFNCLEQMQVEGIPPNAVTFVCSLKACSSQRSIEKGRELHFEIVKEGFEKDSFVGNTLVDMYAKCGWLTEAVEVFDELLVRTVVSWNSVIASYMEYGFFEEALLCFEQMESEHMSPDAVTYVCCLKACGSIGAMERGRKLHMKLIKEGFERDPYLCSTLVDMYTRGTTDLSFHSNKLTAQESLIMVLANAVIDMYGKCGSMIDSQKVFDATPLRDLLTWSALVNGYSRQGECKLVFSLFERMSREGIEPDGIIFLSLLNVCSHVGLMDKSQKYFDMMTKYGIPKTIEHHNCIIDLFGRAGILDRAMLVLEHMPFQPDFVSWSTMLCACRRWGTVELGRQAFEYAARNRQSNATAFILMSNMYAAVQMCEE